MEKLRILKYNMLINNIKELLMIVTLVDTDFDLLDPTILENDFDYIYEDGSGYLYIFSEEESLCEEYKKLRDLFLDTKLNGVFDYIVKNNCKGKHLTFGNYTVHTIKTEVEKEKIKDALSLIFKERIMLPCVF
jgi:hypothetical protein